jgi:uncharacterized short protein YbdD (DUF466 family)
MRAEPGTACAGPGEGILARARGALAALRRIAGMPDYRGYVEHLRRHHPTQPAPSEAEYFRLYVESRYGNGPSRCC